MAAIDPAALEQKILREVLDWEDKWLEKNQRRQEVRTIVLRAVK